MRKGGRKAFPYVTIASLLPAILAVIVVPIRAGGNPVTLICSAVDKNGGFVGGLGAADFRVDEEGKRQTVSTVAAASRLAVKMLVMVDMSGSSSVSQSPLKPDDFIDFFQLSVRRAQDRVAVVAFHGSTVLLQDYTDDAVALAAAIGKINSLQAGGSTALYDVLMKAVESLAQVPLSRKVIILMSDAEDTSSRTALSDVQKAMRNNNVKLYLLSPPVGGGSLRPEANKFSDFVEQTGGLALIADGSKQIVDGLKKIGAELQSQYAISYDSTPGKKPGSLLRIRVSTPRKGVTLHCPTSILAGP